MRFRDARIRKRMPQSELAAAIGYSTQTISNWENNRSKPHASQIEKICDVLGLNDEIKRFLFRIHLDGGTRNIELTPRENALCLALAELHYGSIWKWEPLILPGIVQIRAYQEQVLKIIEDLTDELSQFGWNFKNERQFELKQRLTPYRMSIIIGDSALYHLREMERMQHSRWLGNPNHEQRLHSGRPVQRLRARREPHRRTSVRVHPNPRSQLVHRGARQGAGVP
jgi:transcriptional regulator with XRE-family HTH domain